jgi:hypothetical protein
MALQHPRARTGHRVRHCERQRRERAIHGGAHADALVAQVRQDESPHQQRELEAAAQQKKVRLRVRHIPGRRHRPRHHHPKLRVRQERTHVRVWGLYERRE